MILILKRIRLITILFLLPYLTMAQTINESKIKVVYGFHIPFTDRTSDEKYAYLIADYQHSLFVTQRRDFPEPENQMTRDEKGISIKVSNADDIGTYVYRDFSKDSIVYRQVGSKFMSAILVTDKWQNIAWEITDETKKIGEYKCTKATGRFRGRDYTAWFAEEIPISSGPWKLFGLPGLILEAYDSKMEFHAFAKELIVNFKSDEKIAPVSDKKETRYSFEEYKTFQKNYKEIYVNAVNSKFPRGSGFNLKTSDLKINPIELELE
jgi:GLPGLI family protein